MNTNKNAKTILEPGYSYVLNQCCKVGTHIYSLGTFTEDYEVHEKIITDEMKVDGSGYLCVVLQGITVPIRTLKRIEILACSVHTHFNDFLDKEEAEMARIKKLEEVKSDERRTV